MSDMPKSVLYGALPDAGLGVLEENEALGRAVEFRAVMACATVGEVRALAKQLRWTPVPLDPEDQLDDADRFDWVEAFEEREGDWPAMPAQLMLDELPHGLIRALIDRAGATVEATAINGDLLDVPREREVELTAVLASFGIRYRRDDETFGILGVESLHSSPGDEG